MLSLELILQKYVNKIDKAENGEIVLEKVQDNKYDAILMDIDMPIMDGVSTTKIIRSNKSDDSLKNTLIIAVTAHSSDDEIDSYIASGMNYVIPKPIFENDLISSIRKFLPDF